MITQSGCFESATANDTVDTVEEVSAMVDGIVADGAQGVADYETGLTAQLAQHCALLEQRLRLLTWAVVAIVAYIVIKDIKLK